MRLLLISSLLCSIAWPLKLTPVVKAGLDSPVYVAPAPGEPNTLYVVEQAGRILRVNGGQLEPAPFLDIRSKVKSGGEMGLLSVAFSPDYAKNKLFYLNYTAQEKGKLITVIAEHKAGSLEEKRLLTFDQPYSNHNGGLVLFDATGLLYVGTGDGGSAGDPFGNGQNRSTWLGKMLRIDVRKADPIKKTPYSIPDSNPFKESARPEVYAYGLRNPWRFSFDRENGDLVAGDVGQNKLEEIDIIESGKNYGWNVREGSSCYKPSAGCASEGLEPPVFEYKRTEGLSITGGYVYRGKALPDLVGTYVYGDYASGKIWGLKYDRATKKSISNVLLVDSQLPISSFGEEPNGEILVVSHEGAIHRITP